MLAELFPGQGSQHVGMGTDLLADDPEYRGWVEHAATQAGCDLVRVLRRGPESALGQTAVLQPLMVCVSLGYHQHLRRAGVRADLMAGHSLGELSALAAAGVIEPDAAIELAVRRGHAM
jgi:[acyl-carrier-protein] S-malonyltransferase